MIKTLKVKWFNDGKGYGFLENPVDGTDVFVHYTEIQGDGFKTLMEGQQVDCVINNDGKGPIAKNVVKRLDLPVTFAPKTEEPEAELWQEDVICRACCEHSALYDYGTECCGAGPRKY